MSMSHSNSDHVAQWEGGGERARSSDPGGSGNKTDQIGDGNGKNFARVVLVLKRRKRELR